MNYQKPIFWLCVAIVITVGGYGCEKSEEPPAPAVAPAPETAPEAAPAAPEPATGMIPNIPDPESPQGKK